MFYYISTTIEGNKNAHWTVQVQYCLLFVFRATYTGEEFTASMCSEGILTVSPLQKSPTIASLFLEWTYKSLSASANQKKCISFYTFYFVCITELCRKIVKELQHSHFVKLEDKKATLIGSFCSTWVSSSWTSKNWSLVGASLLNSLLLIPLCIFSSFRFFEKIDHYD